MPPTTDTNNKTKHCLCLGASAVRGRCGFNFVAALQSRFAEDGLQFINTGRDGAMACSVDNNLDDILAQPNIANEEIYAVLLLVGTNDVVATLSPSWERIEHNYNKQHWTGKPTLDSYIQHIESILVKLAKAAPTCQVGVVSLPLLGEDLDSVANKRILEYNTALKRCVLKSDASKNFEQQPQFLDFNQAMRRYITATNFTSKSSVIPAVSLVQRSIGLHPLVITFMLILARILHERFAVSWSRISSLFGLQLLVDNIHINEIAGGILLKELLIPFFQESNVLLKNK